MWFLSNLFYSTKICQRYYFLICSAGIISSVLKPSYSRKFFWYKHIKSSCSKPKHEFRGKKKIFRVSPKKCHRRYIIHTSIIKVQSCLAACARNWRGRFAPPALCFPFYFGLALLSSLFSFWTLPPPSRSHWIICEARLIFGLLNSSVSALWVNRNFNKARSS